MTASNGALSWPCTFGQLIFGVFADIISIALLFVAALAKMSVAPAKPLGNGAAVPALELYEIFSVLWAVFYWHIAATWANQLFSFVAARSIMDFVDGSSAILLSSKIRLFALKAHEIGVNCHCIFIRLLKIG